MGDCLGDCRLSCSAIQRKTSTAVVSRLETAGVSVSKLGQSWTLLPSKFNQICQSLAKDFTIEIWVLFNEQWTLISTLIQSKITYCAFLKWLKSKKKTTWNLSIKVFGIKSWLSEYNHLLLSIKTRLGNISGNIKITLQTYKLLDHLNKRYKSIAKIFQT